MTINDIVDELLDSGAAGEEEIDEFFGELMKGAGDLVGGLAGGAVSAGASALGGMARAGIGGAMNKALSGTGIRTSVGSQIGSQIGQRIGGAANTFGQGMVNTVGGAVKSGISSVGSMFKPSTPTSANATNAATGQPINTPRPAMGIGGDTSFGVGGGVMRPGYTA